VTLYAGVPGAETNNSCFTVVHVAKSIPNDPLSNAWPCKRRTRCSAGT
jgi:hypothetical protein